MNSVPRALKRLCAKHRASAKAEVRENAKYTMESVLRSNFAGGGFAKPRLIFLKSFLGWASAPQEGAGGMRGENSFFDFARKKSSKMLKWKVLMSIDKQYNQFAKDFSDSVSHPLISRNIFYKTLGTDLQNKTLLDVACGDGVDLLYYKKLGAIVSGVDASEELIDIAKLKLQENDIKVGLIEDLPFESDSFDIVVSKYAIQTSQNIEKSLSEISRVAKSGALVVYLVTHPIRQFLEKKSKFRDYYKQEQVGSVLFKGGIVAEEPSHTLSEYFSEKFLEKMKLISVIEGSDFSDTSAQQVSGDYYPTFMICKLIKD